MLSGFFLRKKPLSSSGFGVRQLWNRCRGSKTESVMSLIPVQAAYPEHHEYNLSGFAIAAPPVAPGAIRSWTLALAALLLAAACAHAQAVFGAKAMEIADDGAETIPTATYLGSSTTNSAAPQTILAATVLNSTGDPTPAPTGTVTFFNGTAVVGSGPWIQAMWRL
jgi:hypothetical protein